MALFAISSLAASSRAEDVSISTLKAGIEGAYQLEEWHRDSKILRPPVVAARTVLLDGVLIYVAFDRSQESKPSTVSGYARYVLEPGRFSYGYEGWASVSEKTDGMSVSHDLPWQGLRKFAASIENNEIRFRATDGPQEYRFTASGMSYSGGTQTRVYRRVKDR